MKYKSTIQCKRILFYYKQDIGFHCSCGYKGEPYILPNFLLSCKICKKKHSPSSNTILHNTRFGLLKAFRILEIERKNNFKTSTQQIVNQFQISKKSAIKFLNRIRGNKQEVIKLLEFKISDFRKRKSLDIMAQRLSEYLLKESMK